MLSGCNKPFFNGEVLSSIMSFKTLSDSELEQVSVFQATSSDWVKNTSKTTNNTNTPNNNNNNNIHKYFEWPYSEQERPKAFNVANDATPTFEEERKDVQKVPHHLNGYIGALIPCIVTDDNSVAARKRTLEQFLAYYESKESHTFTINEVYPRVKVHATGNAILTGLLTKWKKKHKGRNQQYVDLTYPDTVEYMDEEFSAFCLVAEKYGLDPADIQEAYDRVLSKQKCSHSDGKIEASGPSPLTTMTPTLLGLYQDMHYKEELVTQNVTISTREYERDYIMEVTKLPFSQWRPFVLPGSSEVQNESMLNAIGATLDVQNATKNGTIGQGKVYSAIYKHFQRSMEILNAKLDEEKKYSRTTKGGFEERTKHHVEKLNNYFLLGLYDNEERHFNEEQKLLMQLQEPFKNQDNKQESSSQSAFAQWEDLKSAIDTFVKCISKSLYDVPDSFEEDFELAFSLEEVHGSKAAIVKQVELIGAILGLMFKKEKRLLLNHQMFGNDMQVEECLRNLYKLFRVEEKLNKQLVAYHSTIGPIRTGIQKQKLVTKELINLK